MMIEKRGLRLRIFLFFAFIAAAGTAGILAGLTLGYVRLGDPRLMSAFGVAAVVAICALGAATAWVWLLFDENVAKPLIALAAQMRARAHAKVDGEIDAQPARYLGDLGPAIAAIADHLGDSRAALDTALAKETARLRQEKTRLETILRDMDVGVLLCTGSHHIALYNRQATDMLEGASDLGLNRPLFDVLHEAPIRHAHDRLTAAGDPDAAIDLLCATLDGRRLLRGHMRLETSAGVGAGYVLTLIDVTDALMRHAAGDAAPPWWPMGDVAAADVLEAVRSELAEANVALEGSAPRLFIRCDGFAIACLLGAVARAVLAETSPARLAATIEPAPDGAAIDLLWDGEIPPVATLEAVLSAPLSDGYGGFTGHDALRLHGTDMRPDRAPDGRARLRLPIRGARADPVAQVRAPRPEFYDFDLLETRLEGPLAARGLADLTYVVFDTETTGLAPDKGDEIVQIAAVRIVNGRVLSGETFETLVDPGRPIPRASTQIHGITQAMVEGAPTIVEAGRRFHRFCGDAVLVAHNAPFDVAFLRRHADRMGVDFDRTVLDTVLMSATVFGAAAEHSLDALAGRLCIDIPENARHTALGDAWATAEAVVKLLPMLRAAGIETLGQAMDAFRRHRRLVPTVQGGETARPAPDPQGEWTGRDG